MAKVLLVQAAHIYQHHTHLQPLGIMYIASVLLQEGHVAHIVDMKVEGMSVDQALEEVRRIGPDILGITAMTYESVCMHELARRVRAEIPHVPIVVGGAHPANEPEETLERNSAIDYVCIGEGEDTMAELVSTLQENGDVGEVRGLAYRDNGHRVRSPPRPFIEDIDRLPFPAWGLTPIKKYFTMERGGILFCHREFMTVISSRGCPYRCAYCHRNLGMDDMFNLDRKRVQELCGLINERGLDIKITFPNGLRADLMDEETLQALKKAGMYRTMYAIETASPRLQKYIDKNVKLDKAREIIEKTVKMGVMTHGAFMLGFPTETEEEMCKTIDFALSSRFHTAAFYRVMPFRGSALYDMVRERKPHANLDPTNFEYHSSDINMSEVEESRLTVLRKRAYRKFYMNPVRLFRLLYRLPNKLVLLPHLFRIFVHRALER
jgi:radical SAM superfamily enzyme YgiQ (UPF0313 family)